MITDNKTIKENVRTRINKALQERVHKLNSIFNKMPAHTQRLILLATGLAVAWICIHAITEGFNPKHTNNITIDSMTHPRMQPMENKRDTTELIPLGKMKGEINGQFQAFYVAMDRKGNFFKNNNPAYAKTRWQKSDDWKPLTYPEFMEYEKQLHFLPIEGKAKTLKK